MSQLTHLNPDGEARMVDVGHKEPSERRAIAEGRVALTAPTLALIRDGALPKGDVLATARIAGIMAAKRTADLIPLCHPLALTSVAVDLTVEETSVRITATVKTYGVTGVEMEALTAVSVAALALYDMVKAVEREAVIESITLIEKTGGKSGAFRAVAAQQAQAAPRRRTAPRTLMDPAAVPVRPANDDARREHFRSYLASHRVQVLALAKSAGLAPGLVYGYLHGRTRRLPADAEAALASAAKTSPEALFGSRDDAQRR